MQRLQRFKGQIVVAVTETSEVTGARKASKCEAPALSDEHMMQRIEVRLAQPLASLTEIKQPHTDAKDRWGGLYLRVCGAAHTEHVCPGWKQRATGGSPEKINPFYCYEHTEFSCML